jgi:hypothetical protein
MVKSGVAPEETTVRVMGALVDFWCVLSPE